MNDALGLSIGTINLVAARNGNPPVTRRAVLTLFPHRSPEIGVPVENPNLTESGTVMSGFVECVGDPDMPTSVGVFAADPGLLLVDALDAMIRTTGAATASADIAIAVPAYWQPESLGALRDALRTHADFVHGGAAPRLVPDAVAALTAVHSSTGLPARGVVGLIDFGGGGTTLTLADASSGFDPLTESLRYHDFSGERVDEAVALHVLDHLGYGGSADPAATAAVGPFAGLREECRRAKERLSTRTETELTADLPGQRCRVQLTRAELEDLIGDRLGGVISLFDEMLARGSLARSELAAVAVVGGGASIPLVTQRLSDHLRVPVVTAQRPASCMAIGAAMFASCDADTDVQMPTTMAAMAGAGGTSGMTGLATDELFIDNPPADGTDPAAELAWSQVDDTGDGPVVYADEGPRTGSLVGPVRYEPAAEPSEERPRARPSTAPLLIGVSALVAMVAIGVVAYILSGTGHKTPPAPTITTAVPPPPPSQPPPSSPHPLPSEAPTTAAPPPPPPAARTAEPSTTTSAASPSSAPPATTTTVMTPPTTTTAVPAAPTTPPANAPTSAPPTTPMTTEYLTIPFVPMPIPVPVPQNRPPNPFLKPG